MDPAPVTTAVSGLGPGFFNLDNMLVPQNIALIVVSWSLTELISRSSKGLEFVRERMLPILPVLFCELFVFATSTWQPAATVGERALLGALLGTVTVWGHMAAQKSGLQGLIPFMKPGADAGAEEKAPEPKKEVDAPPGA
jgi:hypothetical protein